MNYYQSPHATVSWSEHTQAVIFEWHGFAQGEQFRTPLEKGLELMKQKKAKKWLANYRNMPVIHQDDQEWMAQDFHHRNIAAGMKYVANIPAEKVVGKSGLRRIASAAKEGADFVLEEFNTVEEALEWLTEVQ